MNKPDTLTHFTAWRPVFWALVVCLPFWTIALMIWPKATIWILAATAGVITSFGLGAWIDTMIRKFQTRKRELEAESREMIQANLDAVGELDATAATPFSVPADLNAAGELRLPDDQDPRRPT